MPYSPGEIIEEFGISSSKKREILDQLPPGTVLWMLEKMFLTRYFEEMAEDLYARGQVHGTMHLSIGMEASPIGSIAAIRPSDLILHHHRGHGHTIAKGVDINLMMGEFLGKQPGYCHGRGGSMHIFDKANGNLGATGIVGAMFSTAVGIGLSLKMRHEDRILLCFFGDGATNEGEFHESMNLAALWKLPIVFICDNNQYGMSMAAEKVMNVRHVADRMGAYNIPAKTVDGNEVLAIYDAVKTAVEWVRAGNGPSVVENLSYRWRGHSKSDRNLYRTSEEIAEWQRNDPIQRFARFLLEQQILTSTQVEETEERARETIKLAADTALQFPEPSPDNMEAEVYAA